MTTGHPGRLGPRSWTVIVVLVLALLGAWLLLGADTGGRTPATPAAGTSARLSPAAGTTAATRTDLTTRPPDGRGTLPSRGSTVDPVSGLPWIAAAELPREARDTLELIDRGGPFPYPKDGSTFNNFEGVLPQERRGFYREYTVDTPGSRDRGARRIVTGDNDRIHYWTDDHYETFKRIRR